MTRILLVEDDEALRDSYEMVLKLGGFEVRSVESADEMEREVREGNFEILISDTEIDDGWGDLVCKKLLDEGRLKDVMIIGISGEHDADKKWNGRAYDFIYKEILPR